MNRDQQAYTKRAIARSAAPKGQSRASQIPQSTLELAIITVFFPNVGVKVLTDRRSTF